MDTKYAYYTLESAGFFANRAKFLAWVGKHPGMPNYGWVNFDKQVMDGAQAVGEQDEKQTAVSVIVDADDAYLFEQIYINGVMPDVIGEDKEMGL